MSKRIGNTDADKMAQAVEIQLCSHVAMLWDRLPPTVVFFRDVLTVPPGARKIVLFDNPDQAGVLGWHSEGPDGQPFGKVFVDPVLDNGGAVLFDEKNPQTVTVSSVFSHEAIELFCDPSINAWVDGPSLQQGSSYALEVCDPVEAISYWIIVYDGTKVAVSDFVGPLWFDLQAPAASQFSYCNSVSRPFHMAPGGYLIARTAPGTEAQVFADKMPFAWRQLAKHNVYSRTFKRIGR